MAVPWNLFPVFPNPQTGNLADGATSFHSIFETTDLFRHCQGLLSNSESKSRNQGRMTQAGLCGLNAGFCAVQAESAGA